MQRLREAEDAYRLGLDSYNAQNFASADSAFGGGLDRLEADLETAPNEMETRRRDLLRTKLSYFLRQARERREAADALVREIQEEEEKAGSEHFSDYPLEMNSRVAKQIEFFRGGIPQRLQLYLSRSGRYSPLIRGELRAAGIPEDLIYLSLIESGFSPNAYSRAHAAGLWQFIQSTGKLYGLKVDKWVDERRDPDKATRAAVRHLKDLYTSLGDWNLALAAYNCGEARVKRAIQKAGTRNFWDLDLPQQTEEYVPRFMAAAYIGKDPEVHGFHRNYDPPLEKETVTVTRSIRLSRIAEVCGTTVEEIKTLNPSLRRDATPPFRHGYELHLPVGATPRFVASLETLSREPEPEIAVAAAGGTHIVRRGETLSKIAASYGTTTQAIAKANRMKTAGIIRAGQRLRIPDGTVVASADEPAPQRRSQKAAANDVAPKPRRGDTGGAGGAAPGETHVVRRGETVGRIAVRYGVGVQDVLRWNSMSSRDRIYPGQKIRLYPKSDGPTRRTSAARSEKSYTVRAGDNLWSIARRFDTTIDEIIALNKLSSKAVLQAGKRIRVPSAGAN